jgi:hypothetical protein
VQGCLEEAENGESGDTHVELGMKEEEDTGGEAWRQTTSKRVRERDG